MLLELHTLHCIHYISGNLPFYLPCFFLCLQFKQNIGPQQPNLDDDHDDDNDDDDDTSAPSSTPEPAPPTD